jgi:hypothetical protein
MTPRQRFNITLEPEQIANLRMIEAATGATASAQIRLALDLWFQKHAAVLTAKPKETRTKK